MTGRHLAAVLAIEPHTRGLNYAAFNRKRQLIDWGGFEARANKNRYCYGKADALIRGFTPRCLVIEDGHHKRSNRRSRIKLLLDDIAACAEQRGYDVVRISRLKVRQRFCVYGISSKDDIASAVCDMYPALSPRLPRKRRPWESEHYSLALFEAVALGVTYFSMDDRYT